MTLAARDNPYRSARVEGLAFRFGAEGMAELEARLARQGGRGLLLGPEGSGKTTLLEAMAERMAAAGTPVVWLRLRRQAAENQPRLAEFFRTPVEGALVCIDGLEQLGWWTWRRVSRQVAGARWVIATSHRPGRLPLLRRHLTSPELLADLVAELDPTEASGLTALWQAMNGDLRRCLRALYDRRAGA